MEKKTQQDRSILMYNPSNRFEVMSVFPTQFSNYVLQPTKEQSKPVQQQKQQPKKSNIQSKKFINKESDSSQGDIIHSSDRIQLGTKPNTLPFYNFTSYVPNTSNISFKPQPVVQNNQIDKQQSKQQLNKQNIAQPVINTINTVTNRIYKGLNKQTNGTYYDINGTILFTNGKLTQAGQQLFGQNANRAQWNMQNGNIFQNNSWRADNTTFDFKNMKAIKGYEDKYINKDGKWLFKDSQDGKWTYFNQNSIINKSASNQKQNKQDNKAKNNISNKQPIQNSVDKNGFVLASSLIFPNQKNTWDLLQGKDINRFMYDDWGNGISSEQALKNKYIGIYLNKYNGRNPIDGTPITSVLDQANKDFEIFKKHYFVQNPSINKNTWYADANFAPKYIHNGKNLALVDSSDGNLPIIQNINGIPYLMDENGRNAIPMIDKATGNQNFYIQETKNPNTVTYNNKHYNVYVPAAEYKNGGQITNKTKVNKKYLGEVITKFDNWINANN